MEKPAVVNEFMKEIGIHEDCVEVSKDSGHLIIKIYIIKDEVKLIVPENITSRELKNKLYQRWITKLESERLSHDLKIEVVNRQINYLENRIKAG